MIKIGVDPAFRKNGFCIVILDEHKELRFITFKKYLHFISWIQNECPYQSIVCIENSYLQNKTFDMRGSKQEVARKSRNVGMNMAASEIAYQLFCEYSRSVKNISPREKGPKWKNTSYLNHFIKNHKIKHNETKFTQDMLDAFKMLTFIL